MNSTSTKLTNFTLLLALTCFATPLMTPDMSYGSIELVSNRSFEMQPVTSALPGYINNYAPIGAGSTNLTGWTVGMSGVDLLLQSLSVGAPTAYVYGAAADGVQFIDLASDNPGRISQVLPTTNGVTYTLNFCFSNNPDGRNNPTDPISSNVVGVSALVEVLNGASVIYTKSFNFEDAVQGNLKWKDFTNDFNVGVPQTFLAGSGPTTLRFTSTGTNPDKHYGILLDKVSVTGPDAAPEASSVATWLLIGLTVFGGHAKIRRRDVA